MQSKKLTGQERAKVLLTQQALDWNDLQLFLRGFKQEQALEIWGKNKISPTYKLITKYSFCQTSGILGPKRKEGDLQIPEGCYFINRFNPKSIFKLSLGLNYPNAADLIHADPSYPGTDIFIHGGCQTTGCIPITDEGIAEVYALAGQAKLLGQQQIPVHIFPARYSNNFYSEQAHSIHLSFWKTLYPIYQSFETTHQLKAISIDGQGSYQLDKN